MSRFNREFRRKFWSRVEKTDACWLWQGSCTPAGYGQLQARKISRQPLLTHRVAWELRNGPIPAGQHVLHRCDTPACVRVGHLFLGTQRDNNEDRIKKGRTASGDRNGARTKPERNPFIRNRGSGLHGEDHPQAKLSNRQVTALKAAFARGENREALAKRFDVSVTHVYRIGKGTCRKSRT